MRLIDFLNESGIDYQTTEHNPVFTAQSIAMIEHEPGRFVAKPIIVKADDEFIMCVLCACHKANMQMLKRQLGAESVELAKESDIGKIFPDCELGAEPPFGNLYNITTIVDREILKDDHILFQAGTHKKAIKMNMNDYITLVKPRVLEFGYHLV